MTSAVVDPTGEATRKAWEAEGAIGRGETHRARELYREAAELLEARLPSVRKQSEKAELRFLAASQYYHGGHYRRTAELVRKVDARLLGPSSRRQFAQFLQDVKERSAPDYSAQIERRLWQAWEAKDPQKIFNILQAHPYVLPAPKLAFLRAVCSEMLKDYAAAAVFYADALRFDPSDPSAVLDAAALPMTLLNEGKHSEAWEYLREQLPRIEHFIPNAIASLVRFHQAVDPGESPEQKAILEEQLRLVQRAWELFHTLPANHQRDPKVRQIMALGLEAGVLGMSRLGDHQGALALATRAVEFEPHSPSARTLRGLVTQPAPAALDDFRDAARLGEQYYYPYYYLAYASFTQGHFREAVAWSEQALQRPTNVRIKAQLYDWLGIAHVHLGSAPDVIRRYFDRACELRPEDERIRRNAELFEAAVREAAVPPVTRWDEGELQPWSDAELPIVPAELKREPDRRERIGGLLGSAA